MNEDIIKELNSILNKAYGDYKSAAVIIAKSGKKYFGVSINIEGEPGYTPAITNAICNAVSEGERKFKCLYVLFENYDESSRDKLVNFETQGLLKEFSIEDFVLFTNETEEIIKCC